jgi:hypothetical protein
VRITNILLMVFVLALAMSCARMADWAGNSGGEPLEGSLRSILSFTASLAAVFLAGLSLIALTLTAEEFRAVLAVGQSSPERPVEVATALENPAATNETHETLFD